MTIKRRGFVGAGLGAAAIGAFVAIQGGQSKKKSDPPLDPATEAFWTKTFTTADGAPLGVARWRGKPLLVNFWATWCPPCVKELPEINQFYAEAKARGWQVLGLAVDQAAPVKAFLQKTPLDFPVALAGPQGLQLVRDLGNAAGGLPFSVVFSETGAISWRRLGVSRLEELRQLARS